MSVIRRADKLPEEIKNRLRIYKNLNKADEADAVFRNADSNKPNNDTGAPKDNMQNPFDIQMNSYLAQFEEDRDSRDTVSDEDEDQQRMQQEVHVISDSSESDLVPSSDTSSEDDSISD